MPHIFIQSWCVCFRPSPSKLDYENACLVARYLAANRPFSQSFDIYLTQVGTLLPDQEGQDLSNVTKTRNHSFWLNVESIYYLHG